MTAPAPRARRFAGRLLLALGALLLTLVVLELALRVAPFLMPGPRGGADAPFRILCVGDSHTYGLGLPPVAAYPAQLQARLDAAGGTIGVKNYGVPGRNSGALLRELPRYLDDVRPDVVIVLVGFNDAWNFDAAPEAAASAAERVRRFFRELRLVRMVRLVLFRETTDAPRIVVEDGRTFVIENGGKRPAGVGGKAFGGVEGEALAARVSDNLDRITALVRDRGARLVFLDYAFEGQATFTTLNETLRAAAKRLDVPMCEIAIPFRDEIARVGADKLFFEDGHPTGMGYSRVADLVAERLRALAWLPDVRAGDPAGTDDGPAPTLELGTRDDATVAYVHGAPDRDVQIAISRTRTPPIEFGGVSVPIGKDDLLERSLAVPALRARLDASGNAGIEIPPELLRPERGRELLAVALVYPKNAASGAPRLSLVVRFTP